MVNMAVPALSSGLHSWGRRRKQIYILQRLASFPLMHRACAQVMWSALCKKLWHGPHWACSDGALLFLAKKEELKNNTAAISWYGV